MMGLEGEALGACTVTFSERWCVEAMCRRVVVLGGSDGEDVPMWVESIDAERCEAYCYPVAQLVEPVADALLFRWLR